MGFPLRVIMGIEVLILVKHNWSWHMASVQLN